MSEHDEFRALLALAVADALGAEEQRKLEQHLSACRACAAELDEWRALAGALKRLPTPQPSAELVERTRALVEAHAATEAERRGNQRLAVFLLLVSWSVTLVSWPIFRLLTNGLLGWLGVDFYRTWLGLAGYTALAWLTAGVAAALLGLRQRAAGRVL